MCVVDSWITASPRVRLTGLGLGGAAHLWCRAIMAPRINQLSQHTLRRESLSWQHVTSAPRIPSPINTYFNQHRPMSCLVGPQQKQLTWRVVRVHCYPGTPDRTSPNRKGCPNLLWSHQPWSRTATSMPALMKSSDGPVTLAGWGLHTCGA